MSLPAGSKLTRLTGHQNTETSGGEMGWLTQSHSGGHILQTVNVRRRKRAVVDAEFVYGTVKKGPSHKTIPGGLQHP